MSNSTSQKVSVSATGRPLRNTSNARVANVSNVSSSGNAISGAAVAANASATGNADNLNSSEELEELCKHCNNIFASHNDYVKSIKCNICRRHYHDHCVTGMSATAIAEAKKPNSNIRYACPRPKCITMDKADSPLYCEQELEPVILEEATEKYKEMHKEEAQKMKKMATELDKIKKQLNEANAKIASTASDPKVEALNATISRLRVELSASRAETQQIQDLMAQRRTSLPHSPNESILTAVRGELETVKQQNARLNIEILAANKTITNLRVELEKATFENQSRAAPISDAYVTREDFIALSNNLMEKMDAFQTQFTAEISKTTDTIIQSKSQQQVKEAPITYASVLSSENPNTIRTIVITPDGNENTYEQLLADRECEAFGLKSIKHKAKGVLTVRSNDADGAARLEQHLSTKYANAITITKPKNTQPMVKLVGVDPEQNEEELLAQIMMSYENVNLDNFKILRKYAMQGRRRNYAVVIAGCSLELQLHLIARKAINLGLRTVNVYEHIELQSCANCNAYGHLRASCKAKLSCRHCAEEHLYADCTNKDKPPICSNCVRNKYPHSHTQNSHFCKSRHERIEGLKKALSKN